MAVLIAGFMVAISGLKPIPVILIVQVLNGVILPLLVIFLILVINDPHLIPAPLRNGLFHNALLLIVLGGVLLMSLNNVYKALTSVFHLSSTGHLWIVTALTVLIVAIVGTFVFTNKVGNNGSSSG